MQINFESFSKLTKYFSRFFLIKKIACKVYRNKQWKAQTVMKNISKKKTEIKSHGPKNLIAVWRENRT